MAASALLVSTPSAPCPERGQAEWFRGHDGARLRAALFQPDHPPRGSVVLSPGRTEAIEKYFEVVEELQARGFCVLVHDWRGQGLSDRLLADTTRGHARGWRGFLADYDALISAYGPQLPRPWIAMGHSMGGGLTLAALAEGEARFAGAVLSAPMLGLRTARPVRQVRRWAWVQTLFGRATTLVFPAAHEAGQDRFEDNPLTHDHGRWRRWRGQLEACEDLRLGGFTWGWLSFALTLTHRLERSKAIERLGIPILVIGAGEDKLCSCDAARDMAKRLPHGRYVEVEGAYHELLMETDDRRQAVWDEFDRLADRVAPPVQGLSAIRRAQD